MKAKVKRLLPILCSLWLLLLFYQFAFGLDKEDAYTLSSGATKSTYSTKICFLFESDSIVPTMENGTISGAKCINQLTWNTPTSGTNLTFVDYTNNDTQRFYQFKVSSTGFTSCGYCPVNNIQISINRRRILPSYVNMITTVGNTMGDFNVHQGSCYASTDPGASAFERLADGCKSALLVLEHMGGMYPCGPTEMYMDVLDSSYLKWMDMSAAIPGTDEHDLLVANGTKINQIKASTGLRLSYCLCGKSLYYVDQ